MSRSTYPLSTHDKKEHFMCFSPEASPPVPQKTGYRLDSRRLVMDTSDGGPNPARLARTIEPDAPGVVILPDQRGLHEYYERLAEVFADAGVHAVAVDFYHRSAGTAFRGNDFDFAAHRPNVTTEHLNADAAAGAELLRSEGVRRVYAVGFCFGGRGALLQAAEPGWSGAVGFYGFPKRESPDGRSPIKDAQEGRLRAPVLALFGAEDETVGTDAPDLYREALEQGGASHEIAVYEGAAHSFFDRQMAQQEQNCADAWRRMLGFIR
jgi:carboxymethylenebutenolidase